jgi:hypothetical protein
MNPLSTSPSLINLISLKNLWLTGEISTLKQSLPSLLPSHKVRSERNKTCFDLSTAHFLLPKQLFLAEGKSIILQVFPAEKSTVLFQLLTLKGKNNPLIHRLLHLCWFRTFMNQV